MENGPTNRKLKPTKVRGGPGGFGEVVFFGGVAKMLVGSFFFVGGKVKTILSFSVFFSAFFVKVSKN